MSCKNSAASDTESEQDFYSAYWKENSVHTNKDLVDSGSESDLSLHPNSQHSLFEKQKGKNKLGKTVLILGKNETNFTDCCKHCPLLQAQKIDNTGEFQVELSPGSVLYLNFKDGHTNDHSSKISHSKCDGSRDDFCLNHETPHDFITENSVTGKTFHSVKGAIFDKLYQKQSSVEYSPSSKPNKTVQDFFPCRETEAGENFVSESFKQSSVCGDTEKTSVKKPATFHSVASYKTDSPQTIEQIYFPPTSGELVISLTLEAAYLDPDTSLADNIISSEVRSGKEDSQRHDLAFKFKGSQQNQLFKKLCIPIVPCPVQVDKGKQKHITPCTNQVACSDTLGEEPSEFLAVDVESSEASQPQAADTESAESSCPDFHSNQGLSTLKLWVPCQLFPSTKDTHANHSPHLCVGSFPDYKTTSAYRAYESEKEQPKACRCVKSVVFTKNKEAHKGKQFRSRHHISKFHQPKALNVEPINKNSQQEGEISELYYVPLTQATKCCCTPLLDWSVDLHSAGRDSERLLSVRRKPYKQTRGGKVVPRFSSRCLLDPISNLGRFQYISPVRRKNNLKMQNILNYWLGWTGQNTQKNPKGEVCPIPNSSNSPYLPADERTFIASPLPSGRNSTVPLSTTNERGSPPCLQTERNPAALYLLTRDQRQPSASCIQTDRDTWSPGRSYSDGRCNSSSFPCCENIVKVEPPKKERNRFTNTGVQRLGCGANCMASGGLSPKKHPVCSCGNMPQCGLFPNGEISELVKKKTKPSPDVHRKASMTESDRMRSPMGHFNTEEACASYHHGFPPCYFYNTSGQGASRNQAIKVASFFEHGFPPKNPKEDVEKSKAVKNGERKNTRLPVGSGTLQAGTHPTSPSNDGFETLKYCHPECSCCKTATKEHFTTSGEGHCFGTEHKRLNSCINRESIFQVDSGQGARSQCKCSQEMPLFRIDHPDMYNGNRAAVSTQKKPDLQDTSQINEGWKRIDGDSKCCHNHVRHSHLQ